MHFWLVFSRSSLASLWSFPNFLAPAHIKQEENRAWDQRRRANRARHSRAFEKSHPPTCATSATPRHSFTAGTPVSVTHTYAHSVDRSDAQSFGLSLLHQQQQQQATVGFRAQATRRSAPTQCTHAVRLPRILVRLLTALRFLFQRRVASLTHEPTERREVVVL